MTQQKCVPCSSASEPLPRDICEGHLKDLPGWALDDAAKCVHRRFVFKNFVEALEFANRVGALAEEMGHHPVLHVGWGFCTVKFKTARIDGLHGNDFVMAALVNKL